MYTVGKQRQVPYGLRTSSRSKNYAWKTEWRLINSEMFSFQQKIQIFISNMYLQK